MRNHLWFVSGEFLPEVYSALRGEKPAARSWPMPTAFRQLDRNTARNQNTRGSGGGGVAVLNLCGPIEWGGGYFCGTDLQEFSEKLDLALATPEVETVLIFANSPGGSGTGVPETARQIFNGRKTKRIVSYSVLSCSASFWITSAASEAYMMSSGDVGSVGVFSLVVDMSKALEQQGIKPEIIRRPSLKASTSGLEPLPDDTRNAMQADVDTMYNQFLDAMALYRKVPRDNVANQFGRGLTLMGKNALAGKAVDGLLTPAELMGKIMPAGGYGGGSRYQQKTATVAPKPKIMAPAKAKRPSVEVLRLRHHHAKNRAAAEIDLAAFARRMEG